MDTTFDHRHMRWSVGLVLALYCLGARGGQAQETNQRQAGIETLSASIPPETDVHLNVVYATAGDRALKLDLYRPRATEATPLVIWVHGGAWRGGSKDNPQLALRMLHRGYAVASVEYRLSQEAIFPAAIEDCKAAVSYLRLHAQKYHLDAERFGAWGASAGGHLVALLGTTHDAAVFDSHPVASQASSKVQAVCNWFGPSDFLRMNDVPGRLDHNAPDSPESQLVGGPIQQYPQRVQRANPITYVSPADPPFLHVHGDDDQLVPFQQSELLHAALQQANVPSQLYRVVGGNHGFSGSRPSRDETGRNVGRLF